MYVCVWCTRIYIYTQVHIRLHIYNGILIIKIKSCHLPQHVKQTKTNAVCFQFYMESKNKRNEYSKTNKFTDLETN